MIPEGYEAEETPSLDKLKHVPQKQDANMSVGATSQWSKVRGGLKPAAG